MVTNLSDLPTEILSIICLKLVDISDYARFGAVCKPWRDIVWQIRGKIPPQIPVLLLFPNSSDNSSSCMHTSSFYHLSFDKKLTINDGSQEKQFIRCYGSSHGWLLMEDYSNMIQLLNPFQSDNNVIQLPSLKPTQDEYFEIKKVVLSHNPSHTSEYVVMVMLFCRPRSRLQFLQWPYQFTSSRYVLAFLKPGDTYWTCVSRKEFNSLDDIIYYEDRFYGVSSSGEVVFCDINLAQPSLQRIAPPVPNMNNGRVHVFPFARISEGCDHYVSVPSLVESSGDLLCVVRKIKNNMGEYLHKTNDHFQIFKLQKNRLNWIELNTLRGHALFIGKGGSTSLLASDFRHCKANHIYFTHDPRGRIIDVPVIINSAHYDPCRRLDVEVFNLAEGSFETLHSESILKTAIGPLWVQPTLNMVKND